MPSKRKPSSNLYLRGGVYWAEFEYDKVRYRRSLRTTDGTEARRRLRTWRQEVERESFGEEPTHSYKEAVLRWQAEVLPKAIKPASAKRYMVSLGQIGPFLDTPEVHQITSKTIAGLISSRTARGATNATIRRDLTALSRLLSACIAWTWITENPARNFDRSIIREHRQPIRPPAPQDIETFLAACPPVMATVVRLLDQTGMREEEAVTLERDQVIAATQQIELTRTKTSRPRTLHWALPPPAMPPHGSR